MGFELSGEKRSKLDILMTPGPMITIVGLIILIVSVFFFNHASPDNAGVDAILAAQEHNGMRLKSMIGLVVGTITSIGGVLLALLTYSRR